MSLTINHLNKNDVLVQFIKKELVLILALTLALLSSLWNTPKFQYIDYKVLILLFNLMVVVEAYKDLKVLDSMATYILNKSTSYKYISFGLIFMTFFASMLVTNDVALITFVPLTLIIGKKTKINVMKLIVFQTLGANLGSSLTPMGNPQNLYIYSFYNVKPYDFFKITIPLMILGIVFIFMLMLLEKNKDLTFKLENVVIKNKTHAIIFSILFFLIIVSVFHIVDYRITFIITLLTVLILNKDLFSRVDYSLLLTFVGFFIFIGNISNLEEVKTYMSTLLNNKSSSYFSGIILSQIISNVPAAMLLSKFTLYYKELLLGVNIGGMGTLIASLASVISYKLYINEYSEENNKYLKVFTLYNLIGLILFASIIYFLLIVY